MQAYLTRMDEFNPRFNAIVNRLPADVLIKQARDCDEELSRGHSRGWLHGIPQAIKDAADAAGLPTTFGSPLLKDSVAQQDGLMVQRMKAAGCLVVGKTNMPEFGLGSHTFNEVFGPTHNAWDERVSAGGSSGGAAVSLALRMLPVADGSDFMGSLRNPAAWNHVWGLRPSQGLVPHWPRKEMWIHQLGTEGPMARSVRDLARLLDTQAGYDPRVPLSVARGAGSRAQEAVEQSGPSVLRGLRVGWLGDLQGHLAMDPGLLAVTAQPLNALSQLGAEVQQIHLPMDPEEIWRAWRVVRCALVGPRVATLLQHDPKCRDRIKAEVLWEHDQALGLPYMDFMRASEVRTRFYAALLELFSRCDVLALPATQVWPFPIEQRWPSAIDGRTMDTYHRWMECTVYATFAGLPALSAPAGFHENGRWPAGIQLIGPPLGDSRLLQVAAAYEQAVPELMNRRPESA